MTKLTDTASSSSSRSGAVRLNIVSILLLIVTIGAGAAGTATTGNPLWVILGVIAGVVLSRSPQVAQQWEQAVVLRLGRFVGLRGPGLFWIVPFLDTMVAWVDQRVITTGFAAEQTLTSDTVPVNVDAVLFWMVHDAQKAALEVQNYTWAVSWAAQTALRDIIGRTARSARGRAGDRRVTSSSARRRQKLPAPSKRPRARIATTRRRCTCAR